MAKPTKPTVPSAPLRSQPDTFSARAETFLAFWPTFATYLDDVGTFTDEQADAALAAALGGDLPSLTGKAGQYLRVNAGATAAEFANPFASPALTGTPTAPTAAAGTNTTQIATTAFHAANTALTKAYASTGQTITAAGLLTLAHGLGQEPKGWTTYLQCVTAQLGYSVGDKVAISDDFNSASAADNGMALYFDATNVYVRYGANSAVFFLIQKGTGVRAAVTNANWQLYVRAFA